MGFHTDAGRKFAKALTAWLQDTRLMSEAVYRLREDYNESSRVDFSDGSWVKLTKSKSKENSKLPMQAFEVNPRPLKRRMRGLQMSLLSSRFIFLETLWEEYLQDLVLELRHKDASIFEPFCEQKFMAGIVRDVLAGSLASIEEIKDEAAARFAAGITRQPWKDQWAQLARLDVGLGTAKDAGSWFHELDIYFEMRNCIIHRQGRVSSLLNQKTDYFKSRSTKPIEIWPQHLDFFRGKFIDCVSHIENKIAAKFSDVAAATRTPPQPESTPVEART
jgi:hypothetical protein